MMNVEMAVQGKVVGVIIPPPDIRAVVDKTAQFVARNGKSFEQRILSSSEGQTAKFNFMKAFDPYHAYYEMKIREVEEGKPAEVAAPPSSTTNDSTISTKASVNVSESKGTGNNASSAANGKGASQTLQPSVSTTVKASIMNPIAQLAKVKPTEAPPAFEFIIAHPSGLTASDVDIIKLTAQYTAINGREFLTGLVLREQRNPQFDFLKPTHMLFSYFTSLVDSYAKIVTPSTEVRERIRENAVFKSSMENSVKRWMWNRAEEERSKKESSAADEERLAFQAIDWFDFTVVETIDFPVDELFELPGLSSMGMDDDRAAAVPMLEESRQLMMDHLDHPLSSGVGKEFGASYYAPSQQEVDTGAAVEVEEVEMDSMMMIQEDTEDMSDLKVVPNYEFVPANKRSSGDAGGSSSQMMIDPISGKAIPIDQMTEHMRIQLLDPKWRQQQKVFMDKQKETGYAEGVSIADSLKQFARKRGDIFGQAASGSGPNSAAAIAEQDAADKKKQEIRSQVQWDGHYGSIGSVQQVKYDLASKAPSAFVPTPISAPVPVIGPIAVSSASMRLPLQPSSYAAAVPTALPAAPPMLIPSALPPPALPPVLPPPVLPPAPLPYTVAAPAPLPYTVAAPVVIPPHIYPPAPHNNYMYGTAPPPPVPMAFDPVAASAAAYEPSNKRSKLDASEGTMVTLIPADQFAARYADGNISIRISLPLDTSPAGASWNLNSQTLTVVVSVTESVKRLKEILSSDFLAGMPTSKQQLKSTVAGVGFLKDAHTLAEVNIGDGDLLELSVKSRGGKR